MTHKSPIKFMGPINRHFLMGIKQNEQKRKKPKAFKLRGKGFGLFCFCSSRRRFCIGSGFRKVRKSVPLLKGYQNGSQNRDPGTPQRGVPRTPLGVPNVKKWDPPGGSQKPQKTPKSAIFGVSLVPVHTPPKLSQGRSF